MKSIDKKLVGQRIKNIRLSKGMTLEEFGKIFNASKGNVRSWEIGTNLPNPERLKMISKIADISVNRLLYGSNEERLANIIHKILKKYNLENDINYSLIYEKAKISLPTNDLTNEELENYIINEVNEYFFNEENKTIKIVFDEIEQGMKNLEKFIQDLNKPENIEKLELLNRKMQKTLENIQKGQIK